MITIKEKLERLREIEKEIQIIYDDLENDLLLNSGNTSRHFKDILSCSIFYPCIITSMKMVIGASEYNVIPLLERIAEGKTLQDSDYRENIIY